MVSLQVLLRALRESGGHQLRDVEKATGVPATNLCSYETGNRNIGLNALRRLLQFYQATPAQRAEVAIAYLEGWNTRTPRKRKGTGETSDTGGTRPVGDPVPCFAACA